MNNYIEEKFYKELVEMSPLKGRDMHNRPPLYDTPDEKIEEIKQFIKEALQEQEERVYEEERQRRKREKGKTAEINYKIGYARAKQEMKEKILQIVIEDVPHKYQERLLKELNI